LGNFIIVIAEYLWLFCLMILLASLIISVDKSSRISATIWVAAGLIMDKIAPDLMALSEWNKELARYIWYTTWITFDAVMIVLIWWIHQKFSWQLSKLSRNISFACLVLIFLQFGRLLDRTLFGTDLLGEIYKYGIPSIYFAITLNMAWWIVSNAISTYGLFNWRRKLTKWS